MSAPLPPPPPPPKAPVAPPPAPPQTPAVPEVRAAGATLGGAGKKEDPAWGYSLTYECAPGTFEATRAALQTLSDAVTQQNDPRTGVVTYAFTCAFEGAQEEPRYISMLELFADSDAAATHLSENEGEAMVEMFQSSLSLVSGGATVVNVDEDDKALQAGLMFSTSWVKDQEATDAERREACRAAGDQSTRFVWPAAGRVVNAAALANKHMVRYPQLRPPGDAGVLLEIRAETETAEVGAATKLALSKAIPQHDQGFVSCFVCDAWWAGAKKHAVGMLILAGRPQGVKALIYRSALSAALNAADGCLKLVTTAQNWEDEDLLELIEYFADSQIPLIERRRLFAGFLIHPAFCQPWHKRLEEEKANAALATADAGLAAAPQASKCGIDRFSIRRHAVTNVAQAIILTEAAPVKADAPPRRDEIVVPLDHLLHKVCRLGRNDREIPIGMIFAQLNRLRALLADAHTLNISPDEVIESNDDLALRMQRLLDQLNSLGYSLPAQGRVPLKFEALEALVAAVESENAALVAGGRQALLKGSPVEYMALQELFPIGSVVVTDGLGGLGGTLVALRVDEAFYEPQRSIFGGRKYSFRLVLESVVGLAGEFVSVRFQHIFEEWTGTKEQKLLDIRPLADATSPPAELKRRADLIRLLGGSHSYWAYRAGCFFPHKARGPSTGGAASADRRAAPGKLVVDTKRGLDLGHAPAASVDDLGVAIANTTKALRSIDRSLGDNESTEKRLERLQGAGITVWSELPKAMELLCWPTVVAFSLTTKQWGHVLVDGLVALQPSTDAWDQLVLKSQTKEMLLAMAESTQRHGKTAVTLPDGSSIPSYRFRDVVDTKGSGVLFLLYGPPGTGKTLAVEALAARFARPLYSLSFAELGSSVAELEERLQDVLALAAHWDALVLLDEGDALVEKRSRGQLLLNSMTGVLLRLLEGFDGSLFITSNRAASFDPAALSRVTLAVRFEPLDTEAKMHVWTNMLSRIVGDGEGLSPESALAQVKREFDMQRLSQFTGSGRAVGVIIRLALGLCGQRRTRLTQGVLDDAIDVWKSFHDDLCDEGATQTWDE